VKLTSALGGIQQPSAPETVAQSVTPLFFAAIYCKRLETSLHFIINNFKTDMKPQAKVNHDVNFLAFTPVHNILIDHGQVENHISLIRID